MISTVIYSNDKGAAELLIDYQNGVGFTVILKDKTQIDFGIEAHEWDVLKTFLEEQRAAENKLKHSAIDGGALEQ